jgi:hypothetical protein
MAYLTHPKDDANYASFQPKGQWQREESKE